VTTKEAIDHLSKALKEDPDYYRTWVANIAVAIQDEFAINHQHFGIHTISNLAAERFLDNLMREEGGQDE